MALLAQSPSRARVLVSAHGKSLTNSLLNSVAGQYKRALVKADPPASESIKSDDRSVGIQRSLDSVQRLLSTTA